MCLIIRLAVYALKCIAPPYLKHDGTTPGQYNTQKRQDSRSLSCYSVSRFIYV